MVLTIVLVTAAVLGLLFLGVEVAERRRARHPQAGRRPEDTTVARDAVNKHSWMLGGGGSGA